MLVLTRKQNEKIRVGDSIVITVLRMKGKAVRLGIEAPAEVNVLRGELAFEPPVGDAEEPTEKSAEHRVPNSRREAVDCWPAEKHDGPTGAGPLHAALASHTK